MSNKKSIKKDIESLLDMLPNLTDEQKEKVQEIRDILKKKYQTKKKKSEYLSFMMIDYKKVMTWTKNIVKQWQR